MIRKRWTGCFEVSRSTTGRHVRLSIASQSIPLILATDCYTVGLISYSEATRYTPEKYAETLTWCKAHGRPLPQHTLYPRTKGFITTVQQLRETPHVKAVYDLTIAYAEKSSSFGAKWVFLAAPDMWQSLSEPGLGGRWKFHVHVERYPLKILPESEEGLKHWLEEKWIEKGVRLEQLRRGLLAGQAW